MFEDLAAENRCYTDRNPEIQKLKLLQKIKYLEKENGDLLMDLEDVETSLQLGKNMISILTDCELTSERKAKELIEIHKEEIEIQRKTIKQLRTERDDLKSSNLLLEQVKSEIKCKEEETVAFFEAENMRVVDALEK